MGNRPNYELARLGSTVNNSFWLTNLSHRHKVSHCFNVQVPYSTSLTRLGVHSMGAVVAGGLGPAGNRFECVPKYSKNVCKLFPMIHGSTKNMSKRCENVLPKYCGNGLRLKPKLPQVVRNVPPVTKEFKAADS